MVAKGAGMETPGMMPGDGSASIVAPDDDTIIVTIKIRRPTAANPKGYIGASSSHPPLPGEDWRRGSDLADGECNEAVMGRVMDDLNAVVSGHRNAFERDNPR